jgi:hypothetical protein
VRLQRERERELAELERATRTVFAFNISLKADERDIFSFFSKAGQVGASVCRVQCAGFRVQGQSAGLSLQGFAGVGGV